MARTVKSVMSCEPKRASPYSVDLRWCMVLQNNHILRHVEITSMYGNTSTQCCKDSAKPCTVVPLLRDHPWFTQMEVFEEGVLHQGKITYSSLE